jgi:two-component system OmpR family sensor kinase
MVDHSGRRLIVPARVRITGWVMLLTVVVLVTVAAVTRDLLLRRVDGAVATSLEQEAAAFSQLAAAGVDRATGQPLGGVRELLYNHLQRRYPDKDAVLVGWVATATGGEVLRQQRAERFPLSARHEVLDPIVASDDRRAEVDATVGTLVPVSLLGLALAGGIAWVVAGQILAPVRVVRRAAAQITEQDLTRRIPVNGRDDFAALAEQFNAMLDRLELAFTSQRQFIDDASHELRTPITIIRGQLEVMGDDPVERAEVVRLCTDELDRMGRIVTDLLVLAISERPDFVRPERVELAELTCEVDAKIRALANRRWRLEAIAEGSAQLDPQRITQALVQLAQNAVQHSVDGDEIRLGSSLRQGKVSFWVTDTGPGVTPQDTEKIFQRFGRGSNGGGPGDHRAGAGLGLAIVMAIADAHGGSVRLLSTPGQGSTFGFELPAGVS